MLGIEESGQDSLLAVSETEKRLEEAMKRPVDEDEQIYEYDRDGDKIYLKIEKQTDEQSTTYYVSDLSQWWKELNELREQSSHDSLTGLYNRRGFNNQMDELFEGTQDLGWGMIIMMDADGLKRINDMYGHSVGDEYLKRIGAIIKDTAGPGSVCARLGGDEFIVFLYGYDSRERVDAVCGALKEKRGEAFMDNGTAELVEFSIGCAIYPVDGKNYHVLMHRQMKICIWKRERERLYTWGGIKRKYTEKPHLKQADGRKTYWKINRGGQKIQKGKEDSRRKRDGEGFKKEETYRKRGEGWNRNSRKKALSDGVQFSHRSADSDFRQQSPSFPGV